MSSHSPSRVTRRCILVCQHRSCVRNDSESVLATFQATLPQGVFATGSDCMGQCASGATVRVMPDGTWYCRVKPTDVAAIVESHILANQSVERLLHPRFHPNSAIATERSSSLPNELISTDMQ